MSYGEDDERPWTEERWESFMKERDLRSARFGELLETLRNHPNRDEVVAREMGWNEIADALAEQKAQSGEGGFDWEESEEDADEFTSEDEDADFGSDPFSDDDEDPVESLPVYALATDTAEKVHTALKPWMQKHQGEDEDEDNDTGERLAEAFIGTHIAAAKIAGGHGMGYEDDVLCGNIVCCKRALEGARQTETALIELRDNRELPAKLVDALLPDVRAVRAAIVERIADLRSRVWW